MCLESTCWYSTIWRILHTYTFSLRVRVCSPWCVTVLFCSLFGVIVCFIVYCWIEMPFNLSEMCVCELCKSEISAVLTVPISPQHRPPQNSNKNTNWMHSFERETQYCQHLCFVEIGNLNWCCVLTARAHFNIRNSIFPSVNWDSAFQVCQCDLNHFNSNARLQHYPKAHFVDSARAYPAHTCARVHSLH